MQEKESNLLTPKPKSLLLTGSHGQILQQSCKTLVNEENSDISLKQQYSSTPKLNQAKYHKKKKNHRVGISKVTADKNKASFPMQLLHIKIRSSS